jgi:hypothetical protein
MGTPGLGVQSTGGYPEPGTWSASFGWRYQKSDRHFVGSHYEPQRDQQESQVINGLNMADLSIRYQATTRTEVSLGMPFVMATRSQALRSGGENLERYQTQARGIGDVVFSARRWMFDPDTHLGGNLQLGIGVKLPTGPNNITDTFRVLQGGQITNVVRTVDQSIQPGDGGFGIMVDFNAFKGIMGGKMSLYTGGAYLMNPQETSNVLTYRGGAGEQHHVDRRSVSAAGRRGVRHPRHGTRSRRRPVSASRASPCATSSGEVSGSGVRALPCRSSRQVTIGRGKHGVTVGVPIADLPEPVRERLGPGAQRARRRGVRRLAADVRLLAPLLRFKPGSEGSS